MPLELLELLFLPWARAVPCNCNTVCTQATGDTVTPGQQLVLVWGDQAAQDPACEEARRVPHGPLCPEVGSQSPPLKCGCGLGQQLLLRLRPRLPGLSTGRVTSREISASDPHFTSENFKETGYKGLAGAPSSHTQIQSSLSTAPCQKSPGNLLPYPEFQDFPERLVSFLLL